MNAAYDWVLAMCRYWLAARMGDAADFAPLAPLTVADWDTAETLGHAHSLEPIFFSLADSRHDQDDVPDHLRARWEKAYYSNRIQNAEALDMLSRVVERCRASGVSILALKGPAAMADVYQDIGLRVMADLDILCRPSDLLTVTRAARALGFRGGDPYLHNVALQYRDHEGGALEVHFTMHYLVKDPRAFLDGVWAEQLTASAEEWAFPVMSIEHQLVFDVAHCAHHDFDIALKHVLDFAGRLRLHRHTLRWPMLTALLAASGLTEWFWLLVRTFERMLRLPLVDNAGPLISADTLRAFERAFLGRSRTYGLVTRRIAGTGLLRQHGVAARLAYARSRLFPPAIAIQAAFDLNSPMQALLRTPLFAGKTLVNIALRRHQEHH